MAVVLPVVLVIVPGMVVVTFTVKVQVPPAAITPFVSVTVLTNQVCCQHRGVDPVHGRVGPSHCGLLWKVQKPTGLSTATANLFRMQKPPTPVCVLLHLDQIQKRLAGT